jgi:hypothetical protein
MGLFTGLERLVCRLSNLSLLLIVVSFLGSPMAFPLFWIALISQLIIVIGYFWFYRKEQLCT